MRTRHDTYTAYSVGCAGVWGVILLLARCRLDAEAQNKLQLACGAWWMGWTSATIARTVYPPPKQLSTPAEKRVRIASLVLIALGVTSTIRMLAAAKRPPTSASVRSVLDSD